MQIRMNLFKQFLCLFMPVVAIFGLIVIYFYSSEIEKEGIVREANETMHLNLGRQVIEKDIKTAYDDLMVLSQHIELDTMNRQLPRELMRHLAHDFIAFAKGKRNYDQIRLLDEAGKEVIRVDFSSGQYRIVPADQLQDKSKRPYFKETIRLKEGGINISPMNLNIEHGKVEKPVKPVIRLATAVLYGQEKKRGVVVINYLGSDLMRDFKAAAIGITDHAMLVDPDGLWIYSPRTELEWGAQLGPGYMFMKQFPGAWEKIAKEDSGQFYTDDGLFTFVTVHPQALITGATVTATEEPGRSEIKGKEYYWKIVAHIPGRDLDAAVAAIVMRMLLVFGPVFGMLVAGSWWLRKARAQRLATEESLVKRVHQQAVVAELGQRALSGVGLAELMDSIVDCIAQVMEVEYCQILELSLDGNVLRLSAGHGWQQGHVGQAIIDTGMESQEGYTLTCNDPVIVDDLRADKRFTGSPLLLDHGVVSGMSISIHGGDRLFGILGIHTIKQRIFTIDDVHFLRAVANILSGEIRRESAQALAHLQVSALKATADSIVITGRDGSIQWINPAYTRLTGYEFDEVQGKNPRILKSGKQSQTFYKRVWDTIQSGKTWRGELWNKRKDGSLYLEEESITPVLDKGGEISHFIAIKRDESERQRLQQQLQQAQKMEAIGQLTGGIAHDFNNMLVSIMGYTELAREGLTQCGHERIDGYLSEVYKSSIRARDLVAQMLAFSRGGEGELKPLALSPLIKESLKMLGSILPSSIEIDLQLDGNDLTVMTNPVQLHQLVMNLSINARDVMEGKGRITIGLQRINDVVTECRSCHERIHGDYIQLVVGDAGSGIEPEQLDRIFDPFYTTKEVGKGTGMGLSMVHGIMHDHGGHILVETEAGKGSTFTLLFPVIDAQVDTVNVEDSVTRISLDQTLDGSILIVDDEPSVGRFIGELMKGCGCRVTVETDSRSALSTFKENPQAFDLVITDQTMPKMTGAELAQSLLAIRPELPVILCTGYSEQIDETMARSFGIQGYVNKPIATDEFLELAGEMLQVKKFNSASESAL